MLRVDDLQRNFDCAPGNKLWGGRECSDVEWRGVNIWHKPILVSVPNRECVQRMA